MSIGFVPPTRVDSPDQISPETKQAIQIAPIPTTRIPDGDFVSFRINVPAGFTLKVWILGVQNDSNNAPANLDAIVRDETNGVNITSQNSKRATGSPIAEKDGAIDVSLRINNGTGSIQNASAIFGITIEPQ